MLARPGAGSCGGPGRLPLTQLVPGLVTAHWGTLAARTPSVTSPTSPTPPHWLRPTCVVSSPADLGAAPHPSLARLWPPLAPPARGRPARATASGNIHGSNQALALEHRAPATTAPTPAHNYQETLGPWLPPELPPSLLLTQPLLPPRYLCSVLSLLHTAEKCPDYVSSLVSWSPLTMVAPW